MRQNRRTTAGEAITIARNSNDNYNNNKQQIRLKITRNVERGTRNLSCKAGSRFAGERGTCLPRQAGTFEIINASFAVYFASF